MSVVTELNSHTKTNSDARKILGPGGNRVQVLEEEKKKKEGLMKKLAADSLIITAKKSVSSSPKPKADNGSAAKSVNSRKKVKESSDLEKEAVKVVGQGVEKLTRSPLVLGQLKRCDWITPFSEPIYTAFHDGEWGVPVYDERKLFELLVLSQTLAELQWPAILSKRECLGSSLLNSLLRRKLFDNFDPRSVAAIDDKKLLTMRSNSSLSDQKLRAIFENSKQVLKIHEEFGSFSNYCWRFLNHKPIINSFRYTRQVPAKSPKSELISKDLMSRGFRCVGPTVVYSFMQVAGMVNDHLVSCFRYNECCNTNPIKISKASRQKPHTSK